ncbi:MAG: formimidoylglutamate deiminase, partial [Pseudomonadota bacterium]
MPSLYAESALIASGWAARVRIEVDAAGTIAAIAENSRPDGAEPLAGVAVPGMPNLHCHAFQRAMAGLAERAGPEGDDFWSWREVMYRFLAALSPVDIEAIATQLYVEFLKHGYTAVAEFHYLHNDPDGRPYADPAELAGRIAAAAGQAGIGLTLLPVLYQTGNFGGAPPAAGQRRFLIGTDDYVSLLETLHRRHRRDPQVRIGMAPHSLRAVPPAALAAALQAHDALDPAAPVHIHVAEQVREVEDCQAWSGRRPVAWLLANAPVGKRWCLVHATQMSAGETEALARSGAVVGLCPSTEANLGDGIFPLPAFLAAGGRFGIGTDSNVATSPVEELRWLEYGQRLARRERNVAARSGEPNVGARLYRLALAGGARACGRRIGAIEAGHRADLVVLDADHPLLVGRAEDTV